jgi:hypothetical protein
MELKIFGKSLFSISANRGNILYGEATVANNESKFLLDFYVKRGGSEPLSAYIELTHVNGVEVVKDTPKKATPTEKPSVTPKKAYDLQMLNNKKFVLKTDAVYVDGQLADFKEKLGMLDATEYDMRNGIDEIASTIIRLENRKKYASVEKFFEQYPYTMTTQIAGLINAHSNLQLGKIAQFIADLPKEAISAMKDYDKNTVSLCGKRAVYYIVADKKDFKKSDTRRDPILLAQSPFGHFWQILGAWDKEMLFLEEL